MDDHEAGPVEVSSHGARIVCSCNWSTHPTLEESYETRRQVLARWYDHFAYQRRLAAASGDMRAARGCLLGLALVAFLDLCVVGLILRLVHAL